MENTDISWADDTFNPWWGCEKISPACTHCYAQTFADRFPASRGLWGKSSARRFQSDKYWNQPLNWDRKAAAAGERRRVFCASMADVFEDREDLIPHRARLFDIIRRTPNLDWLLLTKRPENWADIIHDTKKHFDNSPERLAAYDWLVKWRDSKDIPANVWIGTTVENQEMADKRIPELLKIPAKVRFLSCEPLLGPVDLQHVWLPSGINPPIFSKRQSGFHDQPDGGIHWVICGGESGRNARPMHPDWARSLRAQCAAARVPFHFKQWGEWGTERDEEKNYGEFHSLDAASWVACCLCSEGTEQLYRVGTARAGRQLDGVSHDAFPSLPL